jgi:hypothetical protein
VLAYSQLPEPPATKYEEVTLSKKQGLSCIAYDDHAVGYAERIKHLFLGCAEPQPIDRTIRIYRAIQLAVARRLIARSQGDALGRQRSSGCGEE